MASSVWSEKLPSGRFRVCWRNRAEASAGGEPLRVRDAATVGDAAARDELVARVRRALDLEHFYVHRAADAPQFADFELAAREWVRFKEANGASPGTLQVLYSACKRIFATIRAVERIPAADPVSVRRLSVELATRMKSRWRQAGLSPWRVYDLSLHFLAAWQWVASQPDRFEGTPHPPLTAAMILPEAPPRVRAPEPEPAEVDAVCRRAAASGSEPLMLIVASLRLTGLRIGQVLAFRRRDFNLSRGSLVVATGKSKREKAEQREVAVSPELLTLLRDRLEALSPDDLLFPSTRTGRTRQPPTAAVRRFWEMATAAGEARREVWAPRGRKARPDHAFRAAFLAMLREEGVDMDVRHALVGHAEGSTEERHYAGVKLGKMAEAIRRLPPIDWIGPVPVENVTKLQGQG